MKFKRPRRKVEMLSAPGLLRVTITSQWNVFTLLEGAVFTAILCVFWKQWNEFHATQPILSIVLGIMFASTFFSWLAPQIACSEEIEFSQHSLLIRKSRPLSLKRYEFSLYQCTELQVYDPGEGESDRLQCFARGERLTFGDCLSDDQAINILVELQRALPDAADQLCACGVASPFGKHFTTLNLS